MCDHLGCLCKPLACQSSPKMLVIVVSIYTLLNDVQMSSKIKDTSTQNNWKSYNIKQDSASMSSLKLAAMGLDDYFSGKNQHTLIQLTSKSGYKSPYMVPNLMC